MAIQRVCSIPDCDKFPVARGWCSMHYQRWERRGDPLWQPNQPQTGCSIPNCSNAHKTRGFCRVHYARLLRYGNPLGGSTLQGEPLRYFHEVVLSYDGDDCLTWPHSKFQTGYGQLVINGKRHTVSRLVCEKIYGAPPSQKHYAAHSCGRGHLGCVAKRHLSWKTPSENQMDRVEHGTSNRGTRSGSSKLNEKDVLAIHSSRDHSTKLAKRFGVSEATIRDIQSGRRWGWLTSSL